jgi:ATP-dependent Lon protease
VTELDVDLPETPPVLPLKETVVFPDSMVPLAIGQERSVQLIDDVVAGERMLALVTVRDPDDEQPTWEQLYRVGTVGLIHKMIKVPDGTLRILVQGLRRVRLTAPAGDEPYLVGALRRSRTSSRRRARSKRSRGTSRGCSPA